MAHPLFWKSHLEIVRGDPVAALIAAEALEGLGQEHGLPFWRTDAGLSAGWARGRLHDIAAGAEDLRRGLADRIEQGSLTDAWFYHGLLAELEVETLGTESALARIDEAMALARQVEARCNLPFLHLLRGKLLLERDPSSPAPAEEAFKNALGIAREQGARSWGLRAALSLAKLYQSTARLVDADTVLAPALEGFSPTPEMPEIAEAEALLVVLAKTEEVKAAIAQHERRLRLQTAYGYAAMWSKGFAADETKAAFDRAAELAANTSDFSERFAAAHGQWSNALLRGELTKARSLALSLLREAEEAGRNIEVRVARRSLAIIFYFCGEFREARNECECLLDEPSEPGRDRQIRERFGDDIGAISMSFLAVTDWHLGDTERARKLIESSKQRAIELEHFASMATPLFLNSCLELLRGDAAAALRAAEAMEALGRDRGMTIFCTEGQLLSAAARGQLADPAAAAVGLRQGLAAYLNQGGRLNARFYKGLLAQLEAEASGAQNALTIIDEALAEPDEGERWDLAFMHRLRGDILLKCGPSNGGLAEDAFKAAIALAKEQAARSPLFLASLALAKLYQSTDRSTEAHAVLAHALEGFSPTPEMPEIAEAQALLERLAGSGEGAISATGPATQG
jgi:predicted ATPase